MLDNLVKELEHKNNLLELVQNDIENIKNKVIEELKNTNDKNYRSEKALYSLRTISNDEFEEEKFKEEHKDIYNKYLKTKVSFDITTFKKKEKELVEKYTKKGEATYGLTVKQNKNDQESESK